MGFRLAADAAVHPLVLPARADAEHDGQTRELARLHAEESRPILFNNDAEGVTAVAREGARKKELS